MQGVVDILLFPAPRTCDFRGGVNWEESGLERARASDTRARLARCEIYRLAALILDQGRGGVCLALFLYLLW